VRIPKNPSLEFPLKGLEGFIDEFLVCRLEELSEVKIALGQKDYPNLLQITHKWRGISAPYGFGELAVLAIELEDAVESYQTHLCENLVQEVELYLAAKGSQDNAVGP
jgi:HPt (histidine-containing phosphotransfer) domain-containing protein